MSGWNLKKDGTVNLDGEWEFYFGQLLEPDDFKNISGHEKSDYLPIPSTWRNYEYEGKKINGKGYATYRLKIIPEKAQDRLALRIFDISSAYRLWINGQLLAESGKVGKSSENEVPNPSVLMPEFQSDGEPIELVLQVSNHYFREGGITSSVRIGHHNQITAEQTKQWGIALFFVGSLLVMGGYHLVLFLFRRKNPSTLYFGFYCLLWMANFLVSNSSAWVIRLFLPVTPIQVLSRLDQIFFFLTIPVGYQFFRSLYPKEFSRKILIASSILAVFFTLLGLTIPVFILTALVPIYFSTSALLIVYSFFKLNRARLKKLEGATFILIGFIIIGSAGINDMLTDMHIIQSVYLIHVGVFFFVLFQAFALSLRFSKAFSSVENLSSELKENYLKLSKLDRIKDEFLANTSHELRTPLSGIIGLSESMLAGSGGELSRQSAANLIMIVNSAKRLSTLVNDILDFSRLENNDLKIDIKAVDLRSIADIAIGVIKPLAQKKGISIENAISMWLPFAEGDEDRLIQIFFNLLGNAVKFTDKGEIRVSAKKKKDMIEIAVSDTGTGIHPDSMEIIFRPFEQDDSSASMGGVGLGLSISHHLTELHGGRLWAESSIGKGSTFHFTIPVCKDPDALAAPSESPAPFIQNLPENDFENLNPIFNTKGLARILAVDDDPVNLQVLRNHLSLEGMAVTTAKDGMEALALVDSGESFDLILLDLMMPGLSGFEVCKELRRKFSITELPIIILTARKRLSDITKGLECGANDYLGKPFAREELLARTRVQLKIIRAEEEARRAGRLAMLGELAASIAHEVNTPINTIINSSQLILMADSREELEQDAGVIKSEGRRIAGIVSALLSFARTGSGEKAPCRIGNIISESICLVEAKLRNDHIRLQIDIADNLPEINMNSQLITQVFLNIINNAAHALNEKYQGLDENKKIIIEGELINFGSDKLVRLTFKDFGTGIPESLINRIMMPFFTTKPVGKGTGLGLSVSQNIISDHRGSMVIESEAGISTTVIIDFPIIDKNQ
ncbi:ATP-binding protein [Desulforegula conservatrix]|uniref:ATP-binding protein n=1 Tax=Desulforegula conservatrix TaxID=153026 RepID=UPI0004225164|nr:ATP-binding protein [Desulforegula conservatrix]